MKQESDQTLFQIVTICQWIESNEGMYALLHKGECGYLGQMIDSRLSHLRQLITSLVDSSPQGTFAVNMRGYRYPLDAYCELADVVRKVEEERGLEKDTLWDRFVWIDAETFQEEMILEPPTAAEIDATITSIRQSIPPTNDPWGTLDRLLGLRTA